MTRRNYKSIISMAASAVLLSGLALSSAHAEDEFVFRVEASSLDTPREVSIVYDRLVRDVTAYCEDLESLATTNPSGINLCVSDVVATVIDEINVALLTSHHESRRRTRNAFYTASL